VSAGRGAVTFRHWSPALGASAFGRNVQDNAGDNNQRNSAGAALSVGLGTTPSFLSAGPFPRGSSRSATKSWNRWSRPPAVRMKGCEVETRSRGRAAQMGLRAV
jgi:hypothetical protein